MDVEIKPKLCAFGNEAAVREGRSWMEYFVLIERRDFFGDYCLATLATLAKQSSYFAFMNPLTILVFNSALTTYQHNRLKARCEVRGLGAGDGKIELMVPRPAREESVG